jgi:hypothetical protein
MSITITGGISFSGGIGIIAPPAVATAGWFAGGTWNPGPGQTINWVERMIFATDTAATVSRAPLVNNNHSLAAAGTLSAGWFGGGYGNGSTIQRITYTTDTATPSIRGPLSQNRYRMSGTSDTTTYGWYGGATNPNYASLVDRVTYASDTTTTSVRGPLTANTYYNTATGTVSYGWYAGGGGSSVISSIDRITYANDTATATSRGPLSARNYRFAGSVTDSNTYGWFAGGKAIEAFPYPAASSTVNRITYANDTVTTSIRGPLSSTRYQTGGATCNDTYGWIGGGGYFNPGSGFVGQSSITRITYANDTVTSANRGLLGSGRITLAGSSGQQ